MCFQLKEIGICKKRIEKSHLLKKLTKKEHFFSSNSILFVTDLISLWCNTHRPVVTVDIIQPTSLLDHLHSARDILPRGEAVPPFVLFTIAGFDAAAIGALFLPAGVVVGALLGL